MGKEREFVEVPLEERLDHYEPDADDSNAITDGDADEDMIAAAWDQDPGLLIEGDLG